MVLVPNGYLCQCKMMHTATKKGAKLQNHLRVWVTCSRLKATLAESVDVRKQQVKQAKSFNEIPGPVNLPFLGTAWQLLPPFKRNYDLKRWHRLSKNQYLKYGPIWKEDFPGRGVIVNVVEAEDIQKVLSVDGKFPDRFVLDSITKYRNERIEKYETLGIVFGNGEDWWNVRSKAQQPMLRPQSTLLYLPNMAEVAQQLIDKIRIIRDGNSEVPGDFMQEFYKWSLESVSLVALDARLGCLDLNLASDSEPSKMIQATNDTFATLQKLDLSIPFWKYFPSPTWKKMTKAQDCFTDISMKYIERALEKSRRKSESDENSQLTILEALLQRGLSPKSAVTMTIDMLMAGIDTTSHSTAFLFYLLAKNPDKQERLRQEIDSVFPSKDTAIEPTHMNELHYLKACVKESLRLFPAAIGVNRVLGQDVVLSNYFVPKGTLVFCLTQTTSRLEKYFSLPNAFIPERWIKGHPLEHQGSPYAVLPFGFGTRACIGRRLAEQEIYLLTVKALQNFRIEYHYEDLDILVRLVNVPDQPLRFKFVDR